MIVAAVTPGVDTVMADAGYAVTAASFVVGLFAQRRIEKGREATKIREGVSGLGDELLVSLDALRRKLQRG